MDTPVDDPVELLQLLQDEPWLERLARETGARHAPAVTAMATVSNGREVDHGVGHFGRRSRQGGERG